MPIKVNIAPKGTCWWNNDWNPHHITNMREDKLFSLSRVYHRRLGVYTWHFHLGPLVIRFMHTPSQAAIDRYKRMTLKQAVPEGEEAFKQGRWDTHENVVRRLKARYGNGTNDKP